MRFHIDRLASLLQRVPQLAGIESTLKSYEAMIKEQPKARNSFLDGLVAKRNDGSLAKYAAENNCKDKN